MEVRVITSIYHHHTIKSHKKTPNSRSVTHDPKPTMSLDGSFIIDITAVSEVHEQTYSAKTIQSAQKQHSAGFRAHSFPDSVSDPAAVLLGAAIFLWLIFTGQGCMAPLYPPPRSATETNTIPGYSKCIVIFHGFPGVTQVVWEPWGYMDWRKVLLAKKEMCEIEKNEAKHMERERRTEKSCPYESTPQISFEFFSSASSEEHIHIQEREWHPLSLWTKQTFT